ncbi:MAG TPA: DinB family protein [Gemmatimonadales bacterium]|nr:DinB family protein [Gemmatimonadales bacterium]
MTVAEVRELFAYNAWANRLMFAALRPLPVEQYVRDLKSSHGGVHGTLCHIVWAEQLWLTRWLGRPAPPVPQGKDLATLAAAEARWEQVEAERAAWLADLTERRLDDTWAVRPSSGGEFVHTLRQMVRHAIDHSSYHRGQIVTLLRQLGVTPPSTGLIVFYRSALPPRA